MGVTKHTLLLSDTLLVNTLCYNTVMTHPYTPSSLAVRVVHDRLFYSPSGIGVVVFNLPRDIECREQVSIGSQYPAPIASK